MDNFQTTCTRCSNNFWTLFYVCIFSAYFDNCTVSGWKFGTEDLGNPHTIPINVISINECYTVWNQYAEVGRKICTRNDFDQECPVSQFCFWFSNVKKLLLGGFLDHIGLQRLPIKQSFNWNRLIWSTPMRSRNHARSIHQYSYVSHMGPKRNLRHEIKGCVNPKKLFRLTKNYKIRRIID